MLKFFKNLLWKNKVDAVVVLQTSTQNNIQSEVKHDLKAEINVGYEDNDLYHFSGGQLSDFEIKLYKLISYDGFERQKSLEQLKHCFDAELFPHLLERLSDYVEINRKLAASHVLVWSERADFSQLCMQHVLLIAALQNRARTDAASLQLLLVGISTQTALFLDIFSKQQGLLPRTLLKFILQYQWIDKEQLFELCRLAKDQHVRKYWLDEMIQHQTEVELLQELKQSKLKDVQYQLFDHLYQKNALVLTDLVLFWTSKFPAIMDYAYFALKQKKFNFGQYFSDHPLKDLSIAELRIRAKQWILIKGNEQVFFKILTQIGTKEIVNALIFKALKQQYLNIEQCLNYYQDTQHKLEFWQFLKLRKMLQQQMNLDEIQQCVALIASELTLEQRLSIIEEHGLWDKLYWLVLQRKYIHDLEERAQFDQYVHHSLKNIQYAIYGAQWTIAQHQEMAIFLPEFIQSYPLIFAKPEVEKILKPYLQHRV